MQEIKKREEIDDKYKWNLPSMYTSKKDIEKDLDVCLKMAEEFAGEKDKILLSPQALFNALVKINEISKFSNKAYVYAFCKVEENVEDPESNEILSFVQLNLVKISKITSFLTPLLIKNAGRVRELAEDPILKDYKIYIENKLFFKDHTLSEEQEELLSQTGEIPDTIEQFSVLTNVDMKFDSFTVDGITYEVSPAKLAVLLKDENREVRRLAHQSYYKEIDKFKNTLSSLYIADVKRAAFYTKVRKYKTALERSLFAKKIPEEVYINLMDEVEENFDRLKKFYDIRAKLLGISKLQRYDSAVSCSKFKAPNVKYEEAVDWVLESVSPLGEEYCSILRSGLTKDGWVDVFPNKGKRSGAFSSGCYLSSPFILLNYNENDNYNSVITLAHEAGHSMHSYYSRKSNPYQYSRYSIFEAEIASTFNEHLLFDLMYKRASSTDEKIFLLDNKIMDTIGTLHRQTMFARYEYEVHKHYEKGEGISIKNIEEIGYNTLQKYDGKVIDIKKEDYTTFLRVPHFYYNFYVFQYSTGVAASLALSERVLKNPKEEAPKYIEFLKVGGSLDPIDSVVKAGVNLRERKPIQEALAKIDNYISELEKLI